MIDSHISKKDKKFLIQTEKTPLTSKKKKLPSQLLLFPQEESSYCPIRETILNLNLLEMTPLQAMQKLDYLQKEIKTLSD